MAGLAPVPHDSGTRRGRRTIVGGRRALRQVLFQAALAAASHNQMLMPIAKRLKKRGKPHKLVIIAVARRLVIIANAVLKTATHGARASQIDSVARSFAIDAAPRGLRNPCDHLRQSRW
ncbi:transposase [Sphingopyxis bauzanensis]|uniref:transposase n=1 Tax=Sphingopyxis bauzanensis TaxID=651663 RepID=UPI00191C7C52